MYVPQKDVENTIWGKVVASPRIQVVVSLVSSGSPVACPDTKGAPENELTNLKVSLMQVRVNN